MFTQFYLVKEYDLGAHCCHALYLHQMIIMKLKNSDFILEHKKAEIQTINNRYISANFYSYTFYSIKSMYAVSDISYSWAAPIL